jgi:site-specific recombinase XerC
MATASLAEIKARLTRKFGEEEAKTMIREALIEAGKRGIDYRAILVSKSGGRLVSEKVLQKRIKKMKSKQKMREGDFFKPTLQGGAPGLIQQN